MQQLMHQLLGKHRVRDFSLAMPVPCWTCVADVCDECMDCLDILGTEVSLVTQSQLEFTTGSRQPLVAHHVCDVEAKCGGDPGHCSQRCLLYTSDAADDLLCVDLGGRR